LPNKITQIIRYIPEVLFSKCENLLYLWSNMKAVKLNYWFIFMLTILFSRNAVAQISEGEVLRLQITKETNDTSKVKLMIRYVMYYAPNQDYYNWLDSIQELSQKNRYKQGLIYKRFKQAVLYSDKAYKFSNDAYLDSSIVTFKDCIDGLDSMGIIQPAQYPLGCIQIIFDFANKQEEKFKYYIDKVVYYKKHGPIENTANCYEAIAGYYFHLADYDKAIEYYLRSIKVYETFDPPGSAIAQSEIGNAYLKWGNLEKAEEYLKAGLKENTRLNFGRYEIYCYNNLVELYLKRHDYKRALQSCYSLDRSCSHNAPQYNAINLLNIAAVYLHQNDLDSAKLYLTAAEKINKKEKMGLVYPYGIFELDYYTYLYFVANGEHGHALKCLTNALTIAHSSKYIPLVLKYTSELHSYLLGRGDSLQALRFLMQYKTIQDSLNALNTRARIATFEIEQQQQKQEKEIEQLQIQKATQRNYYLLGGAFLILVLTGIISRMRYKRRRDKEMLTADFEKQLAQAQIVALRAQMNPHFIFNCLNSINNFILHQQHELASDYLIKFSKLIRLVLDNSRSETISLAKELETLKLYVTLESARYKNKFTCIYSIGEDVNTDLIMVPPMLLQPFVENAIWHGLMQKKDGGTINIEVKLGDKEFLKISIEDDGIGREKAAKLKSKSANHNSHGLKVTSQRIEIMNKLNSSGAQLKIIDLYDESDQARGTKVELIIPY
jgi:tetratricopeptide (TPR) repeat protein